MCDTSCSILTSSLLLYASRFSCPLFFLLVFSHASYHFNSHSSDTIIFITAVLAPDMMVPAFSPLFPLLLFSPLLFPLLLSTPLLSSPFLYPPLLSLNLISSPLSSSPLLYPPLFSSLLVSSLSFSPLLTTTLFFYSLLFCSPPLYPPFHVHFNCDHILFHTSSKNSLIHLTTF